MTRGPGHSASNSSTYGVAIAVRLQLRSHMVNFQGYPHGGGIFSLADVAFGVACNSHGEQAGGLGVGIKYPAPGTAEAGGGSPGPPGKKRRGAGGFPKKAGAGGGGG